MQRKNIHVHVAARHQHIGAADEGRRHDAVGDDVDLPDGGPVEEVALDHHVADDEHSGADEQRGDHAGNARHEGDGPNEASMVQLSGCCRRQCGAVAVQVKRRPARSVRRPIIRMSLFDRQRFVDQLLAVGHILGEFRV